MSYMYVPILKNREQEMLALKTLYKSSITSKILPLIEVIQEAPNRGKTRKTIIQQLNETIPQDTPFMVEILKIYNPKSTTKPIERFLIEHNRNLQSRFALYSTFSTNKNIIPLVSYDPEVYNYAKLEIVNEASTLRKSFSRLAFRLKLKHFSDALKEIIKVLAQDDIIILDINASKHNNPTVNINNYNSQLNKLKNKYGVKTIIVNSVINKDLTNIGLDDGLPITDIDNSLRDMYRKYGYDAFGDYAAVKNALPATGGTISPGFLFYYWKDNNYIGFKGRYRNLDEFANHIIPTLLNSKYWSFYNKTNKHVCPGCELIKSIHKGLSSGRSQPLWKRIAIMHYIKTMDEFLI